MTDHNRDHERGIDRRTILQGAAVISGAGLVGLSATGTAAAEEEEPCGPGCEPQCEAEVPLCAGQDIEVGTVYVRRVPGEEELEIEYVLDGDTENDWHLAETHLYVGQTDPRELSSAPGQFPFSASYDDEPTEDIYTIGFDEICEYEIDSGPGKGKGGGGKWEQVDDSCGVSEEGCVWVAAHAVVVEVLTEAPYFATDVVTSNQGTKKNRDDVDEERSNPVAALEQEYPDDVPEDRDDIGFFSLGFNYDQENEEFTDEGGEIVVEFDCPLQNGDGDDLRIWEVTFGTAPDDYPVELAEVSAWDGSEWHVFPEPADNRDQGPAGSPDALTVSDFDLEELGLESTTKLRIVDKTDPSLHNGSADGFDLDGIQALQDCTADETAWGDGCGGCEFTEGGNWATYFQYGIGVCEETLPACPLYGTSRDDPTAIFSISYDDDADAIDETQVGDIPDESNNSNYPNGLAFDDSNDVWYFSEEDGTLKTMNEDGALGIEEYGVATPGGQPIAGAAFWDAEEEYLFIPNGGSTLMAADVSSGSLNTRTITNLNWSGIGLGDLAIDQDNDMLYVSTTSSNTGPIFFSVDLTTPSTQVLITDSSDGDRTEVAIKSQIAFDDTGTLWAHNAGNGEWRIVEDLSTGVLSDVVDTTSEYTDIARCGFAEYTVPE